MSERKTTTGSLAPQSVFNLKVKQIPAGLGKMELSEPSDSQKSILALLSKDVLQSLKKHELETVLKETRKVYNHKYRKNHKSQPKYGTLPRWFNDEQFIAFFNAIHDENPTELKLKVLWLLQTYCMMRPLEILQVNISPEYPYFLNTEDYSVRCPALKDGVMQVIQLEGNIKFVMADYIAAHLENIKKRNGFVFYSGNPLQNKKFGGHISPNFVRRIFSEIRQRCPQIKTSYGKTSCFHPNAKQRNLYNITWHSFRHYGGKKAMTLFKDLTKVRDLLRHKTVSSTEIYCKNTDEEINEARTKLWE